MVDFSSADEAALVSAIARSLERLPDDFLQNRILRFGAYPIAALLGVNPDDYARLDLLAVKAEMIRRALRVGRGFGQKCEAA